MQPGMMELGVPNFVPLPSALGERWNDVLAPMNQRPFLRSDGFRARIGVPHVMTTALVDQCKAVVAQFDRFYRAAIDLYYARSDMGDRFLVNPLFAEAIECERGSPISPLPLSRLDCVLTPDGQLKVVEINPLGVCLFYLRYTMYLARELARRGAPHEAERVDQARAAVFEAFAAHCAQYRPIPAGGLTVGLVKLPHLLNRTRVMWKAGLERIGWRFVHGAPDDLELSSRECRLKGVAIDVLWTDFLFYLGYQAQRYEETKFPTRFGNFSSAPEGSARLLRNPAFLQRLADRSLITASPLRAFLTLSKGVLSCIDRPELAVDDAERALLRSRVARTFTAADRDDGALAHRDVTDNRDRFVLKPCQQGGGHAVMIGRATAAEAWREQVDRMWRDPDWVVQEYWEPAQTPGGDYLSLGLYNHAGKLGGVTIRTAPSLMVGTRDTDFFSIVPA